MARRANEVLPRCSEQYRGDHIGQPPGDQDDLWQAMFQIDFWKTFDNSFLLKIKLRESGVKILSIDVVESEEGSQDFSQMVITIRLKIYFSENTFFRIDFAFGRSYEHQIRIQRTNLSWIHIIRSRKYVSDIWKNAKIRRRFQYF